MDPRQIKIYSQKNVPRLNYIAGIVLGDILGLPWEIVTDRRKLGKHPVINYSAEKINGSFKISPDTILFETGITRREVVTGDWQGLPVFFGSGTDSDLPFDIFAASFYLVSRYEEYSGNATDEHGRFKASSSLAFRNGFLMIPVIDLWAKELSKALLRKYPTIAFRRNEFKSLLTIDSDQPFAYLGKNILLSFGGMIRDLASKTGRAGDRYKVISREKKDPFEVYDYIIASIEKYGCEAKFFFPTGDHSKYDKNPSWKNEEYRELIRKISSRFAIGIHPSYYSSGNQKLTSGESLRLKEITGKDITCGRFHFIRVFTPASYVSLYESGITEDYSMGYPEEPGFRAGIARPYPFYDVSRDQQTNLMIFPFQVMDATLYQYKNMGAADSKEIILRLINETRKAGGLFVSLWHNTSLLETNEWKEWRELFESMLKLQQS